MSIPSKTLRGLLGLTKKRDSLISKLKEIEGAIAAAFSGATSAPQKRGRKPGSKAPQKVAKAPVAKVSKAPKAKLTKPAKAVASVAGKRGRRGALKEQILGLLKKSGAKGISVKDISDKLGVKAANVHVWFGTTGKTAGIVRVAPGVYRLK